MCVCVRVRQRGYLGACTPGEVSEARRLIGGLAAEETGGVTCGTEVRSVSGENKADYRYLLYLPAFISNK